MADAIDMSNEPLAKFGMGGFNLSLGAGLPGTEDLDGKALLERLYLWAERVCEHTNRWLPRYRKNPDRYDRSPGRFRMLCLVTILQRDFGVRYNPDHIAGDHDAADARADFIHGLLTGYGGTCATMPPLYIAVGRALGYPLKLVQAKEHLFARWDEPGGERFNIECTSLGFVPYDDEHYLTQPRPLSRAEVEAGVFLRSLTPREELGAFLKQRAQCLFDNMQWVPAMEAMHYSGMFFPDQPGAYALWATANHLRRMAETVHEQRSRGGPRFVPMDEMPWPEPKNDVDVHVKELAEEDLARILRVRKCKQDRADRNALMTVTTTL